MTLRVLANSKHWFTTSFLRRKVPESDDRSAGQSLCIRPYFSVETMPFIPVKVPESDARSVGSWQNQRRGCSGSQELLSQGGKRWKVSRKTKREREELLFCRRVSFSWFSVIHVFMPSVHALRSWWGRSPHWKERISGAVCHSWKADDLLSS